MNLHQLSSGDLIADRRAEYAYMLAETSDHTDAADLMRQALELVPDWAAGWFRLADYEEKSGRKEAAATALKRVLELNPADIFGAGLKLALLGGANAPEQPPSLYVERLFDDYADRFDAALVDRLNYTVPQKLASLIADHAGPDHQGFLHTVDLGCGTGLFGAEIRNTTRYMEGFDLSTNMLAKAEAKKLYNRLAQADLSLAPEECGLLTAERAEGRADLVSAADVLMYLGNLEGVFDIAGRLLSERGLFAFSVEDLEAETTGAAAQEAEFALRPSLRYAHSEAYIRRLADLKGFAIADISRAAIRDDGGKPVFGILFLAVKSGREA
ncbi:putative TPR repeat methyltransferase [Pararhizobium capsulatum DSM 1112]|uniref:TPR repeat methyltransferase n=1 Tax=Pararhizobium capsulatum DSM 1112 TaxID=1121113 RepID=A0ABU0BKV4_9HYPH|nr:methyltransferase [Pararhizobium capsulatum]MDQ0318884.1 putative TPR repeat methyltransferase [Pararhizobium capsulatum DSM 1112]